MYVGAPGKPRNIRASVPLRSVDNCKALLQWDQPVDVTMSFISHYIVDFKSVTLTTPQFTAALIIENCNLSVAIGVTAVDMCSRQGARAEVVLQDVLRDTGIVAKCPSQTTTASQPDASTCTLCKLII